LSSFYPELQRAVGLEKRHYAFELVAYGPWLELFGVAQVSTVLKQIGPGDIGCAGLGVGFQEILQCYFIGRIALMLLGLLDIFEINNNGISQ
jgi:hypothetical protein